MERRGDSRTLAHPGPLCRTRDLTCSTPCSRSFGRRSRRRVSCGSPCSARSRPTSPCRRMPTCWSPSMPPWTLILLPALGDASRALRRPSTWGRHLPGRRGGALHGPNLPLTRVPPTCGLPRAQLRPAPAPQRRSPDRGPESSDRRRSAHRPLAAYRRALCRTSGYARASGRAAGRRASQDLSPSERRAPRETDFETNTPCTGVRQRSRAVRTQYALAEPYRSWHPFLPSPGRKATLTMAGVAPRRSPRRVTRSARPVSRRSARRRQPVHGRHPWRRSWAQRSVRGPPAR